MCRSTSMLYTQEENLNNGEDALFLLFISQGGGGRPLAPPAHAPLNIIKYSDKVKDLWCS